MTTERKKWHDPEGELLTEEKPKLRRPDMYRIVLLNDDYTPREFVVWVLMKVFHKGEEESIRIMLEAHTTGKSLVGVFTYDIAQTKVMQVENLARKEEYPLKCILEVEEGGEEE